MVFAGLGCTFWKEGEIVEKYYCDVCGAETPAGHHPACEESGMRRRESKAIRADKAMALRAKAATAAEALREPPPDTWSAIMPAYCYTVLCSDPELREPSEGVNQWKL